MPQATLQLSVTVPDIMALAGDPIPTNLQIKRSI